MFDIKTATLMELKALVYDLMAQAQKVNADLNTVNGEIELRLKAEEEEKEKQLRKAKEELIQN